MEKACMLVIGSRMDTSPNVITEAHAVGIPVIGLKNVINHDDFWPLIDNIEPDQEKRFGAYLDVNEPLSKIHNLLTQVTYTNSIVKK